MPDGITVPKVDTSSYGLPTGGPTMLETAHQIGTLEQQKVQLDQSKLNLMNDRFKIISNELGSLASDPNITREKVLNRISFLNKLGFITQDQVKEFSDDIPHNPSEIQQTIKNTILRAGSVMEKIESMVGKPTEIQTGQRIQPGMRNIMTGGFTPSGPSIPTEAPPTTETLDADPNSPTYMQKRMLGTQPPPPQGLPIGGVAPVAPVQRVVPATPLPSQAPGGLPTGVGAPQAAQNGLPVAQQPAIAAPMGGPPRSTGPVTGMAPLFDEGKRTLTEDQTIAAKRMMAAKPAIQALDLMKQPGFLSGPGTEEYTKIVAALKTWGLIETAAENDPTAVRQEVAKKLAQYVSGSPVAARSDASQLLAEASSPNPKVQILPALIKLTKDAVILDRVQSAMPTAFKNADLSKYGQHRATFPQSIDERAFGLDLEENGSKLVDEMAKKLQSKNAREKAEANKFFNSLRIAKDQGFYQ